MNLIVKSPLSDQIVEVLRARIILGALPTDTPIRQDALAAELGVSKIPLREAFARLEQEGLVVSRLNRGFFVRELSCDEAYDVFDLRLKIEPDAVGTAAERAETTAREEAHRALLALNMATEQHAGSVGVLNRAFHLALIRPGNRPVTLQTVERLHVIAERYVVKHLEPAGRGDRALAEHQALYAAWAAGQADTAARLCASHIVRTLADLKVELERTRPPSS